MTRHDTLLHPYTSSLQLASAAGLLTSLALLAGCDRSPNTAQARPAAESAAHSEDDGHDHGAEGHDDHGHEHGEESHADTVRLTPDAVERYGVVVDSAQLWQLRPTLIAPARVGFNTEAMAHVGSPLRGRITELTARLGDSVKRGDPLATVESPELGEAQAEFLLRRSAEQAAAPATELAKIAWDRSRGLHESTQGISLTEVQRREAEYRAAVAAQQAAGAATTAARSRLRLMGMDDDALGRLAESGAIEPAHVVRAPIDGQIVEREVTLGELVSPDRESLLVLANLDTLWVLADVPEARLAEIRAGARAWVVVGTAKHEGAVSFIAPLVDPTTRTAQVRVEVPIADLALKPGMFATVEIVAEMPGAGDPPPTVAVPDDAIQTVEGEPAVFVPVRGEPNAFEKRAVSVGKAVGRLVPIHSGLVDGERFVSAGSFLLKAELGKASAEHVH